MVGLIQEKLKSRENEASDPAESRSTRDPLSAMSRRRTGARLKQSSLGLSLFTWAEPPAAGVFGDRIPPPAVWTCFGEFW